MTLNGTRVLVVEDESLICMLIEEYLSDFGCIIVATAASLQEGLVQANTAAIDVAILDVNLDGALSYPIAVALEKRRIPFLFATGYGVSGMPLRFIKTPVLSKPFRVIDLEHGLNRAITESEP